MPTSHTDEDLLPSIASLSPPLSLKSGTLELTHMSDPLPLEINSTPEPILNVIPCTTQTSTSTISTQPTSSTLKFRHSPTSPPHTSHIPIDNRPIPPKKKYIILEDLVFIDSGILPPTLHPLKTPPQSNTKTGEFKTNLPSLYMTPTQ